MMNKFELFCMIYYTLDHAYEKEKRYQTEGMSTFLGEMNPFVWTDECSADPAVYEEYKEYIDRIEITPEKSFDIALHYLRNIKSQEYLGTSFLVELESAMNFIGRQKWETGVRKYLAGEHKGGEIRETN